MPCSPLIEIYNPFLSLGGNPNDHDVLFGSVLATDTSGGAFSEDISTGSATQVGVSPIPGGTSAMVIDGAWDPTVYKQASNIYFTSLRAVTAGTCMNQRCAFKLTQQDLQ